MFYIPLFNHLHILFYSHNSKDEKSGCYCTHFVSVNDYNYRGTRQSAGTARIIPHHALPCSYQG